jgi:hypothetical protein
MIKATGKLTIDETSFKTLRNGGVQLTCNTAGTGREEKDWTDKPVKFYTQLTGPSAGATCAASSYDGAKSSKLSANPWSYLEEKETTSSASAKDESSFATSRYATTCAFLLLSLIASVFFL